LLGIDIAERDVEYFYERGQTDYKIGRYRSSSH
jgi:hypothetical protein